MYNYTITPKITLHLMRIEGIKEIVSYSSHCLSPFMPSSEIALHQIKEWAKNSSPLTEFMICSLHALEKNTSLKSKIFPLYRTHPLIMRDSFTNATRYIPPNSSDIPLLMKSLVNWIHKSNTLPIPLIAAMAHYQFQIIMPFEDRNFEGGCLFSTLLLNLGGYGLNGAYSLSQLYNKNRAAFEETFYKNTPHNYYLGEGKRDITSWIEFFIENVATLFESLILDNSPPSKSKLSNIKRDLDLKQRKVISLFKKHNTLSAQQIGSLFDLQPRTRAILCKKWTEKGFLEVDNPSNKGRTYKLAPLYEELLQGA